MRVPSFCRLLCAMLMLLAAPAFGADPQPYAVTLVPTRQSSLDAALRDASSLISLQKKAPVSGFALVQRAKGDLTRFQQVLQSFGYYKGQVTLTIDGRSLDDPTLPDVISRAPARPPSPVRAAFVPGPQFRLARITVHGALPPDAAAAIGLRSGQPALAADVVDTQTRLLAAIRNSGYPLAKVDMPPATVDLARHTMDVDFEVTTGPRATFGPITIKGLKRTNEAYVRRRLTLHQGQLFSQAAIAAAQQDLAAQGPFAVVRIDPADQLDANGQLPLIVDISERPLHAVDAGIAYSTDLGINLNVGWRHRNLFGNGEQLNLTAQTNEGGNAQTKPGYLFGAQFIKPDFLARDQSLELDVNALRQALQAYDQRGLTQKAVLNRKLSPHWSLIYGVSGEQEEIEQQGLNQHYNLIGLPVAAKYDSTTDLFNPTSGIRGLLSVTPTGALGSKDSGFVILEASGSTYFDFGSKGRTVLALRALVGEVPGAGVFSLPPDQRFYAGGSATVRGFRYQSIGPQFADGSPTGGTAIAAGGVELRQRIIGNFGGAAFVDAGQVAARGAPFTNDWRIGVGAGVRYYTTIGPIRLDIAVPVNREPHGDAFEVYIGIGQAF